MSNAQFLAKGLFATQTDVSEAEAASRWSRATTVWHRECFEGILRTGARWRDIPEKYPSGSTCWRRLQLWEEEDVWKEAWRALLGMLDECYGARLQGRFTVTIPTDRVFLGVAFYLQAFSLAPGVNPGGVITSNGVEAVIGSY